MSALPIPTGQPVDIPARPARRRQRREAEKPQRCRPLVNSQNFVRDLCEWFVRFAGAYCTWTSTSTLADAFRVSESTIEKRLKAAEDFGLLERFTAPAFEHWLESIGGPAYGLKKPGGMFCPNRIIVITAKLPENKNPGKYGPLGLDISNTDPPKLTGDDQQNLRAETAVFGGSLPIGVNQVKEETETSKGDLFGSFTPALEKAEPGKPLTAFVDPWESLPEAERAERRRKVEAIHRGLSGRPAMIDRVARGEFEAEHPELYRDRPQAPPEPVRPTIQPVSQGKPKFSGKATPTIEESALGQRAETLIGEATALLADEVESDDGKVERLAIQIAKMFKDEESQPTVLARLKEMFEDLLPRELVFHAIRHAVSPNVRNPGASFSWYINRNIAYYAACRKTDGRATRQSSAAAGR